MLRIGGLLTAGSNFEALADSVWAGAIAGGRKIAAVVSNRRGLGIDLRYGKRGLRA